MKSLKLFLILLFSLLSSSAIAQEVYFSVSGKNVRVDSGDDRPYYDFWIKPKSEGVSIPKLEVYDAGIGGFADVMDGNPDTETLYSLHDFNQLYTLQTNRLISLSEQADTMAYNRVNSQTIFRNRWISLFDLPDVPTNGFVLRVRTLSGNDVNNFKLRIKENNEDWDIYSLDLSIGLFNSRVNYRFQFLPYFNEARPPEMDIRGEEDTKAIVMDAFGTELSLSEREEKYESERFSQLNSWGLILTGSKSLKNNMVILGRESVIPWSIKTILTDDRDLSEGAFSYRPIEDCTTFEFKSNALAYELRRDETVWSIENTTYEGPVVTHTFENKGKQMVHALTPVDGRYVPKFVRASQEVLVNQLPVIQLEIPEKTVSPSDAIILSASNSYDPDGKQVRYRWFLDDELRGFGDTYSFISTVSGTFAITLIADDEEPNSLCTSVDTTFYITVNTQPYVEIDHPNVFANNEKTPFKIKNAIDSDNDELGFQWRVAGVESLLSGDSIEVEHAKPGRYLIELTADDQTNSRNSTYTATSTYKVNAAPVPLFEVKPIIAPYEILILDAQNSYDPDVEDSLAYEWVVTDTVASSRMEYFTLYQQPGEYQISLTVNDLENVSNSIQSTTRSVLVNDQPVPVISGLEASNEAEVDFTGEKSSDSDQSIVHYHWDFGDGSEGEGESVTHEYQKSGTYTVTLTVDDGTGISNSKISETSVIKINKNPIAKMESIDRVAPGETFTLNGSNSYDDDGEVAEYRWYVNGKQVAIGESATSSITSPGFYTVTLVVVDDSGFEEAIGAASQVVHVNYAPEPAFEVTPIVTAPETETVFTASASSDVDKDELSFTWSFNDGTELSGETVSRTFSESGIATYILSVDDGRGLENSIQRKSGVIRVNRSPIIVTQNSIVSNTRSIVLDASKSYDADGKSPLLTWILPDGSKRNDPVFTWDAPKAGIFTVGLQLDDQEGLSNSLVETFVQIKINRPPVAIVDSLINSCSGQLIIFSSALSYDPDGDEFSTMWDFGDGTTSRENNPYHSYEKPGSYNVTLTLDDGVFDAPTVATFPVVVKGSPTAKTTFVDTTICVNSPITFDGSPSVDPNGLIGAYSWDFGDEATGFGENVTHLYTKPGTYKVLLTVIGSPAGNCSNLSQTSVTVNVIEGPEATFTIPEWISPNEELTLDARSSKLPGNLQSATWFLSQNGSPLDTLSGITTSYRFAEVGEVNIRLQVKVQTESTCNTSEIQKFIRVNDSPVIQLAIPEHWPLGKPLILSADSTYDPDGFIQTYQWYVNNEPVGKGVTHTFYANQPGLYDLRLEVSDNSATPNGVVNKRTSVFVNSAPKVDFSLPDTVYAGETITLSPTYRRDVDGDELNTTWKIDGAPFDTTAFKATNPRYIISLIQDDKRGLVNSVDSLVRSLLVLQPPKMKLTLPKKIIRDTTLTLAQVGLSEPMVFVDGEQVSEEWSPKSSGLATVVVGWMPRNEVLAQKVGSLKVYDALRSSVDQIRERTKFNPANPFVTLSMPEINRQVDDLYLVEWFQNGNKVAIGPSATLTIIRGENQFLLRITDQDIDGSTPLEIPVVVIGE